MNCNLCYPEDLQAFGYEQPAIFPHSAANGYEKNMRNSRNTHLQQEYLNNKSQRISLKPKKQIMSSLLQRKHSQGLINPINMHFNHKVQPPKNIHLLPTHNNFYQHPFPQPILHTYSSQPKKLFQVIHGSPISPKRTFFPENRIPIKKIIPPQVVTLPQKRMIPKTYTQISVQPKQQVINSYCQNPTTVPSQWHYVEQNHEQEKNVSQISNASVYRLTINNQCIVNSKRNQSSYGNSSREEKSSNQKKSRKQIIHSSCQIGDLREEKELEVPENKKKGNLAQSHRQMREVRHASMDFLQCKRAQSVDSASSSEISEVIMSHQDFLSRNIVNEGIEQSQYQDFEDQEGIKHNIYVGKTQLLPRESHL